MSVAYASPTSHTLQNHASYLVQTQRGFTLVEMVTVIIILGIVSIGISGVLRGGTQAFIDTTEREQLLRQGSFVIERLNREVANAVPNSVRVAGNAVSHCLEFVPINWSAAYLNLPLRPSSDRVADVVKLFDQSGNSYVPQNNSDVGIVFPVTSQDVYNTNSQQRSVIVGCSDDGDGNCATDDDVDDVVQLTFDNAFRLTSPANRLYIANQAVAYCVRGNSVYRHEIGLSQNQQILTSGGVLMADQVENVLASNPNNNAPNTQNPFRVVDNVLQRNAYVQVQLIFARDNELMPFIQEVHIPNVP